MKFSNILVVFDPTQDKQPALERAVTVAEKYPVNLHIFACIFSDIPKAKEGASELNRLVNEQKERLAQIAESLIQRSVSITYEVEWDKNWYEAVVRASVRNGADAVFKSTYKHAAHQRVLNKSSDWTLIRECLCPVLLVREGKEPRDLAKVLAAIDVRNEKTDYRTLNQQIIDVSQQILTNSEAEVHFVNAYETSLEFPDRGKLLKLSGVENDKVHIQQGAPEKVIVDNARELDVGLVVIGNSARTGLSAVVRGNTAEKILDHLECDVLSIP